MCSDGGGGVAECRFSSPPKGVKGLGFDAVGLDFSTIDPGDNINTPGGFCKAVLYTIALRADGLLWAAPPCSSWVWLSRGSSGRSAQNPMGSQKYANVRLANQQVARVALLILIAAVLHNARVMVEQPVSSLLAKHPRWEQLQSIFGERLAIVHIRGFEDVALRDVAP